MMKEEGPIVTYNVFNTRVFRESMSIPDKIWAALDIPLKEKINEIQKKLKEQKVQKQEHLSKDRIPSQYPSMKNKESLINMVSAFNTLDKSDDEDDTDDEAVLRTSAYMVRSRTSSIPYKKSYPPGHVFGPTNGDSDDVIEVKAHFEYSLHQEFLNKVYAISDGGADSCILGKYAKVTSYTGRYANLIGYDPKTTKTEKVPIVTAFLKVQTSSTGQLPVILKVNEAPYNAGCPITLLSEYQIREYGLVIDSVAKKHKTAFDKHGTQCFHLNKWVHINFEDRGGLMGFEILPFEDEDEEKYEIISITSPTRWTPRHFAQGIEQDSSNQDDYPAQANHNVSSSQPINMNKDNRKRDYLNEFSMVNPSQPMIETQILATSTWHRVIHQDIDPMHLRPYLGWRPLTVIKKTLQKTTQLAQMVIRHPMRRHIKSQFPHMNVTRIDEAVSTDPLFTNCKSLYHGYTAAQIFFGTKSHTIFVYGIKSKGEFPRVYRDFIREHGAPSALRRDNAKEEQSEMVQEINRELLIKDQYTEPYHPQQNPVETSAIRYLKGQISHLLDRTGAPDSAWYVAAVYIAEVHNICSDPSLPDEMTPLQYQQGVTPDISAFLQFTFWQPILYLDHEAKWPTSKERSTRGLELHKTLGMH